MRLNFVSAFGGARAALAGGAVLAIAFLLILAPRASADLLYWENWEAPASVSVANLDGSGGGPLPLPGIDLQDPEGLAYDTVSGRLFIANSNAGADALGEIAYVDLATGATGVLSAPGAPVAEPLGLAVDPKRRAIYWVNGAAGKESLAWAPLDGGPGGTLNTAGATLDEPYKVALEPVNGRVYWANRTGPPSDTISYARLDNSGGADLAIAGVLPSDVSGLAVDMAGGRLFWSEWDSSRLAYTTLNGGAGIAVAAGAPGVVEPYGLAYDPAIDRLYWGNFGKIEERANAIGFAGPGGALGGVTPLLAPVNGPQDPLVIKAPSVVTAPELTRSEDSRQWLSCSQGLWAADYPGSFVYGAPRSYAFSWLRNGQPLPGADSEVLEATAPGKYWCFVTAANQAGSATSGSFPVRVNRARMKVLVKTKLRKSKRRGKAVFRVQYYNRGDLKSARPRVCVVVAKRQRKLLRAPKCRMLGKVRGKGRKGTTLPVYVKSRAKSRSYRLKFVVKGVPSKPSFGRLKVVGKG